MTSMEEGAKMSRTRDATPTRLLAEKDTWEALSREQQTLTSIYRHTKRGYKISEVCPSTTLL